MVSHSAPTYTVMNKNTNWNQVLCIYSVLWDTGTFKHLLIMHLSMVCPRMGGAGNTREIWHFQVFECQFPHPWVSIKNQIPTPGDQRPWIVTLTYSGAHNTPPTPEDILVINGTTNFSNCTLPFILCVYCMHYVMRYFSIAGNLTHILYPFAAPLYIR